MLALWLQILEDMEREFGIKCPSGQLKDQSQEDSLDLEKCDSAIRGSMEEPSTISQLEEEKNKVGKGQMSVTYKSAKNINVESGTDLVWPTCLWLRFLRHSEGRSPD